MFTINPGSRLDLRQDLDSGSESGSHQTVIIRCHHVYLISKCYENCNS